MAILAPPNPDYSSIPRNLRPDILAPLRYWLNHIEIRHARWAHLICKLIPPSCPFERTLTLWGYTLHIPALCKLNPLYEELISLRFRALIYLADGCKDVLHGA